VDAGVTGPAKLPIRLMKVSFLVKYFEGRDRSARRGTPEFGRCNAPVDF